MIYFDSAATSYHKPDQVRQAVFDSFASLGNAGRGAHAPTLAASRLLYQTRSRLAVLFGVKNPSRIAFTANVTEALNIAITGCMRPGDHVITTVCEHNSLLRPLYRMEKLGVELTILPADDKGRVFPSDLAQAIKPETRAIVIGHASNVTGNVISLADLGRQTRRAGILLIVDAAQTAGSLNIDVEEMGIDILCFTGHKGLLGPQGTGGIYVREGIDLAPFLVGGSGVHSFDKNHPADMPVALEAGTANGHGIAGLLAALTYLEEYDIRKIHERECLLARRFYDGIKEIEGIHFYGDMEAERRAPIVTFNLADADAAMVSDLLWEDYGICVRAGAHCAPLIHEHFGTREQGAIRFSFSFLNTEEEVDLAIAAVWQLAKEMEEDSSMEHDDGSFRDDLVAYEEEMMRKGEGA